MVPSKPRVPLSHLSLRVPWHDAGWDGTVCRKPALNTSCLALNRINAAKDDRVNQRHAGEYLDKVPPEEMPPCFSERVSFLSPRPQHRLARHAYAESSDEHRHIRPTAFLHPAFSAAATPFGWLLKERAWGERWRKGEVVADSLVERWGIDSRPDGEPDKPDWIHDRPWVQGADSQEALLEAFFSGVKKGESLVFFYAKRTPLLDEDQWIIVGVADITSEGQLKEWDYAPGPPDRIRSYLWERNIGHSLRPDGSGGVLLPYHDLLAAAEADEALDVRPYMAFVPNEYRAEFSYASELVSQGSAISALLTVKGAVERYAERFGGDWTAQLGWIDRRLGKLWTLRGPYPGLGAVLVAFGVTHGFQLAQHAWTLAGPNGDTWAALDGLMKNPASAPADLRPQLKGLADLWTYLHGARGAGRLAVAKLLARLNLSAEQAARWWDPAARKEAGLLTEGAPVSDQALLANPYLLYECDRDQPDPLAFRTVDQAMFPSADVAAAHPLDEPAAPSGPIDRRRLRAGIVQVLEVAAADGHSLQGRDTLLAGLKALAVDPALAATSDHLEIHADRLAPLVRDAELADGGPAYQLDRLAVARSLIEQTVLKRVRHGKRAVVPADWRRQLDAVLNEPVKDALEERGRQEKSAALAELAASRFSVLIGAAGTGKTTLLKALCTLPAIRDRGVLLLAPTGKARVRLQSRTGIEAQTLAQFLRPLRYDERTQTYRMAGDVERHSTHRTVIVDEASMLTEDQLAALLDALSGVERLVLVGDPSQLPPIGAGRPFYDIVEELSPDAVLPGEPKVAPGFAELLVGSRQRGEDRHDLALADLFAGRDAGPAADEIIAALGPGFASPRLRVRTWSTAAELAELLPKILEEELEIDTADRERSFSEQALGGKRSGEHVYFNIGSARAADAWQVLSPLRGGAAGTVKTNRQIQSFFRGETKKDTELADWRWQKVPRPMGNEGIIYGDKVINLANHGRSYVWPDEDRDGKKPLCYVANGEIGVVTGPFRKKGTRVSLNQLGVTFSSQPGFEYKYWSSEFGEDGSYLELAYSLTVHKAQGSEFGTVFVVLPNPCQILSRELLYTALTRQTERLVLLCQGDPHRLLDQRQRSDAVRRLTNLFRPPAPVAVGGRTLDGKHIHLSRRNELMISKSEVIIANELAAAGIGYSYELPLVGKDGSRRYPDFTIEDAETGRTWYWEHLGMKGVADYDEKWARKLDWYRKQGILPESEGGGENGILVTTEEPDGIRTDQIESVIRRIKGAL